jgi:hypothetical protein
MSGLPFPIMACYPFCQRSKSMQDTMNEQIKLMFSDAIGFIRANFRQMASLCLPILFATDVISFSLARIHQSMFNVYFIPIIFRLLVYPVYTAALIHLMVAGAGKRRLTNSALLMAAMRQWSGLFLLKLMMMAMIITGSFLIIPGLWLWVRLSFAEFYLVVFGVRPAEAIKKSIADTKPFGLLILAVLLSTYVPIFILDVIVDRLIWALSQNVALAMVSDAIFSFIALFVLVILFRVFMESVNRQPQGSS